MVADPVSACFFKCLPYKPEQVQVQHIRKKPEVVKVSTMNNELHASDEAQREQYKFCLFWLGLGWRDEKWTLYTIICFLEKYKRKSSYTYDHSLI
jgi:hypothetical protein